MGSDTPSPCLVFALGCSSCPLPRAPGRERCRMLPMLLSAKPNSPAWTWRTLGMDQ